MDETLSLNQGRYHKSRKFQRESFTNITNTVATANIHTVPNVSTDPDTQEAFDLQAKMEDLLTRLQQAETENSKFINTFATSVNANTNPYLNKTIRFTTGHIAYVTNQGVVKYIPSMDIWNTSTASKEYTELDIPWNDAWNNVPGITIPTTPPLVSGKFMTLGESLGNEGRNVYVDKLITNTTATYQGCYTNNSTTFIGGDPPVAETFITNGNFSQPQIANNSYQYLAGSSSVPGWDFNCVLVNNSTAWSYLMPYPNGDQCASIQGTGYINQIVNLYAGVTYTVSFVASGRNCCDGSGLSNPVNIQLYTTSNEYVSTVSNFQPPVSVWTNYSKTFTVPTSQNYKLYFSGTWTASDRSTAIQNIYINKGASSNSGGTYTYNMCKQAAIDSGYQYFGLQNVNTETKTGYCAVSNDAVGVSQKGTSFAVNKIIPLWASGTNGSGQSASFTNQGTLSVYDSAGTSIYNTDNSTAQPSNYLGCYGDTGARAMPYLQSGNQVYDLTKCQQTATDNGAAPYFGLQNSTSGTNAQCWLSSNIDGIRKYGKATNCTKLSDGTYSGGGWSNAIYSLDPSSFYYLILQDDGNMCIYRGSGPDDYQGTIWCAMTNDKQQKPNPDYAAAKSKYGKNWISSGTSLSAGDFVGSTDGSIYLIMQGDGNLVLYTSSVGENCSIIDSIEYQDIYGGGVGANALYKLDEVAIPGNMGKNGYVNGESKLSEFPADMMTTGYSEPIPNKIDKSYHIIPGWNSWIDGSIGDAKWLCNNEPKCNTIVTVNGMPGIYFIANSSNTELNESPGFTSILKTNTVDKTKINSSCNSQDPISIDTIQWEHYQKGALMTPDTTCSIGKLESLKSKTMDDLKIQLAEVSSQLVEKLNKIEVKNNSLNTQMDSGGKQIKIDVKKYKENAQKILSYSKMPNKKRPITQQNNTNTLEGYENAFINNIVSDSNIVSTQGIYSYIIWSIIATVTVIITIELFTNERNTPLWKLVFLSVIIVIINGLFREYALLVNILIVIMFVVRKKFKLMAKENNNI